MIVFHKTEIEGFGSIVDPITYYWDSHNLTVIQGSNGSGKSTILSAAYWALYGKLLKKDSTLQSWPDIIEKGFKGTKVSHYFSKDNNSYIITRCYAYRGKIENSPGNSNLFIFVNGKLLQNDLLRDKKDYQNEIENILGYSSNLFKNTILFGQNLTRLIRESGPKKKALFDEAFQAEFINSAWEMANVEKKKLEPLVTDLSLKVAKVRENIKQLREKRLRELELSDSFEDNRVRELREIAEYKLSLLHKLNNEKNLKQNLYKFEKELGGYKTNLDLITSEISNLKSRVQLDFQLEMQELSLQGNINDLENKLKTLNTKLASVLTHCPRCKAPLNKSQVESEKTNLKKEQRELSFNIKTDKEELSLLQIKRLELKKEVDSASNKEKEKNLYKKHIEELESKLKTIQKELGSLNAYREEVNKLESKYALLENQKNPYIPIAKNIRIEIRKLISQSLKPIKKEYLINRKEYDLYDWLIKDPLSNKGLRAYIFNSMLSDVNNNLTKYANLIGYSIHFSINLDSANKNFDVFITQGEHIRLYSELSGGQQQLVDVAIAFAVHDTVSNTKACNVLIMDEVFESLSADNIELVIDLIKAKAKTKKIHLITHRTEFSISPITIQVELINQKTVIS